MAEVCPYCRESITEVNRTVCPACQTPHHEDCWQENRGCTVFGCEQAPAEEPKIAVGAQEMVAEPRYFVARDGVQTGPFDLAYLQGLRRAPAGTLAWREGMPAWVPLQRMLERESPAVDPIVPEAGADQRPEVLRFGRGFYLLSCAVLWVIVAVAASASEETTGAVLIFYAGWFVVGTLRTRDVGFKGWYVVLAIVPLANIWLGFHLLFAPRGYAQTKKADTAMKVSLWIVLGLIVAAILAGLLAAWAK